MPNSFSVGQDVVWASQASGRTVIKSGKIFAVIPAKRHPFQSDGSFYVLPDGRRLPRARVRYGGGWHRDEESYVVVVPHPKGPAYAESYYWPRVALLQPVQP